MLAALANLQTALAQRHAAASSHSSQQHHDEETKKQREDFNKYEGTRKGGKQRNRETL